MTDSPTTARAANAPSPPRPGDLVPLGLDRPIWSRFFTVAPLVVIGTREPDGSDNLAPKHLAMPLGWGPYFGFVCTPRHSTYHNAGRTGGFTVTYPRASHVVLASLTASPRCEDARKPLLAAVETFPSEASPGVYLCDGTVFLGCRLERIIDGLGENSLLIGAVEEAFVRREALRVSEGDDRQMLRASPLLAYIDPGFYTEVADVKTFPFPEGFKR